MISTSLHLLQYSIAFLIVNLVWPKLIFSGEKRTMLEGFFANFILMIFILIVMGYILVVLQIFEVLSILFILIVLAISRVLTAKAKINRNIMKKEFRLWIYDYVDGIINIPKVLKMRFNNWKEKISKSREINEVSFKINIISMIIIFSYSFYLRIYDVFANAAPGMSDAYVTLAWIKYVNANIIFHDGIYPQGFYIYQAIIQKFSGLDTLYVVKITGPVNSMLIVLGFYFVVSRLFNSKTKGLVAASVYGVFSHLLTMSQERQVATNAQEFAFVFVFPVLYFFIMYIKENKKQDFIIASCGLALIGLIHAFAFVFTAIGIASILIVLLFKKLEKKWKLISNIIGVSFLTFLGAILPVGIGLLMNKSFHSASADFALAQNFVSEIPKIKALDAVVLFGILVLGVHILLVKDKNTKFGKAVILIFSVQTVILYYFGGILTSSIVVEARARELYSLITPIMLASLMIIVSTLIRKLHTKKIVTSVLILILIISLSIYEKPKPIIPYKMEYNSFVEQYIKISQNYRDTEWLIVSQEEGYALSYGKGWHLMAKDFLEGFNISGDINTPNIFIYVEKNPYPTYEKMIELEENNLRRINESQKLRLWIEEYEINNEDIVMYFDDENLTIYHIFKDDIEKELNKKVLGN